MRCQIKQVIDSSTEFKETRHDGFRSIMKKYLALILKNVLKHTLKYSDGKDLTLIATSIPSLCLIAACKPN